MKPKFSQEQRIRLIEEAIAGKAIAEIIRENKISQSLFYRWLQRYRKEGERGLIVKPPGRLKKNRTPDHLRYKELTKLERLRMVEEVLNENKKISDVSKKYNISRTTIYKWLERYQNSPEKRQWAVENKKPVVEHYFQQTPKLYEKTILSLVAKHPEYNIKNIVDGLPQIGKSSIIGYHGVQNVLRRNNLSTYERRLAYAQSQITPLTRTIEETTGFANRFFAMPFKIRSQIVRLSGILALFAISTVISLGLTNYILRYLGKGSFEISLGLIFVIIALSMGSIFFFYSLKYYLTLAIVLSFSQEEEPSKNKEQNLNSQKGFLEWLLGRSSKENVSNLSMESRSAVGLEPNLEHITLKEHPFISIHIPFYNEKNVVERAIVAATNFDYGGDYEVILCDDSNDETTAIISKYFKENAERSTIIHKQGNGWILSQAEVRPGVVLKHLHRTSREGFKGGALKIALELADPRTEFVSIFDADFVPYPDTLELFIKYFKVQNNLSEDYKSSNVAAVQGYQWHVLNKSENWITRGVRSEYAGSYVIERSGTEIYGGLKQISGAVYMIRKDCLQEVGWGTSITEDFELTLKLYERGYKVVYTPYVQAPAECVSTLKRLIRQRMRWAEGHSHNVKRMFLKLIFNPNLSFTEKLEFLYLSPYYLQAFFFLVGTVSWFISETVIPAHLPFWTALWGWSLVMTNLLALPLMNSVGLFLEESEEKDYVGLASFIVLSYLLVPFQAYASVKGFLESQEGPWFRTPKTGKITDIFTRGQFYRLISGMVPGFKPTAQVVEERIATAMSPYLVLSTANNRFNQFDIPRVKRMTWVAKTALSLLLCITTTLLFFSRHVQEVHADIWGSPLKLESGNNSLCDQSCPSYANAITNRTAFGSSTQFFKVHRNNANSATNNYFWFSNLWPTNTNNAIIPPGNYYVQFSKQGNGTVGGTNGMNVAMQLLLVSSNGGTRSQLAQNIYLIRQNNASNSVRNFSIGNLVGNNIVSGTTRRLALRIYVVNGNAGMNNANMWWNIAVNNTNLPARLLIPAAGITTPEIPKPVMLMILMVIIPVMPAIISGRFRKPGGNIFQEIGDAWKDILKRLLGEEIELDKLPV
jgi:cellulose synthase/poly-beta-1,6-N-acetylglucosamine synthase-like glycosyltransferase/transposase-like protein